MDRNIRIMIAYEGTRYHGWQRQRTNSNTIQEKLETLLSRMTGETIEINGSGRTDAGVHARAQVANFHTASAMTTEEMRDYMNEYLPSDIAVLKADDAGPRFHARLNATGKIYCYRIWYSPVPNVFERNFLYQFPEKLNEEAMREAAAYFRGSHDFKSFCGNKRMKKSTVREIHDIHMERLGEELRFTITGSGFLHHMVRILVGTLIEVGQERRSPSEMAGILAAGSREEAGFLAPANGLCLQEVQYH